MIINKYLTQKFKRIRRAIATAAIITASIIVTGNIYAGAEPVNQTVDVNGKYHAALGLRTETKDIYRMPYYHKKSAGSDKWKHLAIGSYSSEEYQKIKSRFSDVVIKGNGQYTVCLENADFQQETNFTKMIVATDIPNTGQITFSDMVIKVNGVEVGRFDKPYIDEHEDARGKCSLLIINNERENFQSIDGHIVPTGTENKITVTFKVKGFSYKKGHKPKPVETATPAPTKNADKDKKTPAPAKDKVTKPPVTETATPAPSGTKLVVDEKIRPFVIISVIVVAVISIVSITISVTRRKK